MMRQLVAIFLLQALSLGSAAGSPIDVSRTSMPVMGVSQQPCGYAPQVSVRPVFPTPADPITIVASGEWPNTCIPGYRSHDWIGNILELTVAERQPPGTVCLLVITRWASAVDVGTLPVGSYQVRLYIERTGSPGGPELCAGTLFEVSDPTRRIYFPTILRGL